MFLSITAMMIRRYWIRVSFKIPAGRSIALVGPSGSGKTTICSLLPRFYDVTGGVITIDGQDVRKLTLESLRSQIGLVQQDVYLSVDRSGKILLMETGGIDGRNYRCGEEGKYP